MLAEERYGEILRLLQKKDVVRTSEIMKLCDVSSETVRKDLTQLESRGFLSRVHGGAVLPKSDSPLSSDQKNVYVPFQHRKNLNYREKQAMALAAAQLVTEGQVIALDSGTSSGELAKVLKEKFRRLTIVTNSLANACVLMDHPGFTVIVSGGVLASDEQSFVSDLATLVVENLHMDLMFLTTCGISFESGVTDQRLDEVLIHRKMIEHSKRLVVLADHTKFDTVSMCRVCGLEQVEAILTDSGLDSQIVEKYRAAGHQILVAPPLEQTHSPG